MKRFRLGILGAGGKMGGELLSLLSTEGFRSRLELVSSPKRGDSLDPLLKTDLIIEFSSPAAVLELCEKVSGASERRPALIVGATGWKAQELEKLAAYGKKIRILRASNFSLGVFICRTMLELWKSYPELKNWDVRIREWHHTEKKDAPSGTALTLMEALGREAPIESIREGKIVGTHEVFFESDSETLTLIHTAKKRSVFASGALSAAIRLADLLTVPDAHKNVPKRELTLGDLYLRREA